MKLWKCVFLGAVMGIGAAIAVEENIAFKEPVKMTSHDGREITAHVVSFDDLGVDISKGEKDYSMVWARFDDATTKRLKAMRVKNEKALLIRKTAREREEAKRMQAESEKPKVNILYDEVDEVITVTPKTWETPFYLGIHFTKGEEPRITVLFDWQAEDWIFLKSITVKAADGVGGADFRASQEMSKVKADVKDGGVEEYYAQYASVEMLKAIKIMAGAKSTGVIRARGEDYHDIKLNENIRKICKDILQAHGQIMKDPAKWFEAHED